jgi:hypothetical protein
MLCRGWIAWCRFWIGVQVRYSSKHFGIFTYICSGSHCKYLRGDSRGSQRFLGGFTAWRRLEYNDLQSHSDCRGICVYLHTACISGVTNQQPRKASTETLNVQCTLLRDTLEYCFQGNDFTELPNELKGDIQQLLE